MPVVFKRRVSGDSSDYGDLNINKLGTSGDLTNSERLRLERIREAWNFYEGYHWEGIDDEDMPQTTYNYCRAFVNKFVAFEFGKGFTIDTCDSVEGVPVTIGDSKVSKDLDDDGVLSGDELNTEGKVVEKTVQEFLNEVWRYNKKEILLEELGQTKSVTGEAWVKVTYTKPEDLVDPFYEHPNGKIELSVVPTQYVFPEFNQHDKNKIDNVLIMYPIKKRVNKGLLRKRQDFETILYKEYWTREEVVIYHESEEIDRMENPYGIIPIVQIKNFPVAGRSHGVGDLEDIIPLNVEYNIKKSDMSEIIDYHSAPITLVYGSKIGNLEKGANKVWGGLPKDGKVENLSLVGDLTASRGFVDDLKTSMCEIGGCPETVLGGSSAISNTSGVALQYMNGPLIDRTNIKRYCSKLGIEEINKIILYISEEEGLITKPEDISMVDFLSTTVTIKDTLPKDTLMELQIIAQELSLGLECRHGAMNRLGKENVVDKLNEIDREREAHPELFNQTLQGMWYENKLNSGMLNGSTPVEQVRKEMTGQNGIQGGNEPLI